MLHPENTVGWTRLVLLKGILLRYNGARSFLAYVVVFAEFLYGDGEVGAHGIQLRSTCSHQ